MPMHITQHTDYALRLLSYLGAERERPVTIAEISERFGISRSHLMKVANQLVRDGFVEGLRGKGGGLRLAREPEQITIGAVVRRMERGLELVECFGEHNTCVLNPACRLKGVLGEALEAFLMVLDQVTLSDMLGPPQHMLLRALARLPATPAGGGAAA